MRFSARSTTGSPRCCSSTSACPESDGLSLQAALIKRGRDIPTVFLSGHGDVASSVRAIRGGAIDFLEKPCDEQALLSSLGRAAARRRRSISGTGSGCGR